MTYFFIYIFYYTYLMVYYVEFLKIVYFLCYETSAKGRDTNSA